MQTQSYLLSIYFPFSHRNVTPENRLNLIISKVPLNWQTIAHKRYDRSASRFRGLHMFFSRKHEKYCINGCGALGTIILP